MKRLILFALTLALVLSSALAGVSYTARLSETEKIYKGPGHAYDVAGDVGKDGVYTIVEEFTDKAGNLWGRLKSGAGWVVLEEGFANEPEFTDTPYTIRLPETEKIYKGPDFEYGVAGDVGKDGVYTVVEEAMDYIGNIWGRLKSGAGWVVVKEYKGSQMTFTDFPYTVSLSAGVQVFDGPGYDFVYKQAVGQDGVYTVTEEFADNEGNLWGKLKSGAGWVCLNAAYAPVSVNFAEKYVFEEGGFHRLSVDENEWSTHLAVDVEETVYGVRFVSLIYTERGWTEEKVLWSADVMTPDKPLVASVVYWGDMTAYGFSFTDGAGCDKDYVLYLSGRNGAPMAEENVIER